MRHLMRLFGLLSLLLITEGCGVSSTQAGGQSTAPPTQGVTVLVDHTTYHGADSIQVTVQNTLTVPIYTHDTAASCSILTLQEQVNGAWQGSAAAGCPLKRPAMIVKIDAGGTYTATITASYPGLPATTFAPGTYHLVLAYSTDANGNPTGVNAHMVTSALFTVNG